MNYTAQTLQGMSTAQLEQLRHQVLMNFFAPETTDTDRDTLSVFDDKLKSCIPHSFVLSSLFDVEAMCNDIPEHVYESDPSLEWVTCPCCDGEKWLEIEGNIWTKALYSDHRRAYAHRHLNSSYKVCGRCNGVGEVLDDLATFLWHLQNPHYSELKQALGTPVKEEISSFTPIPLLPELTKPLELGRRSGLMNLG